MEIKKKENGRDSELYDIKKEVEEKKEVEVDDVGSSFNRKSIMKDDDKEMTKENVEEDEKYAERDQRSGRVQEMGNREENEGDNETREREGRKRGREESMNRVVNSSIDFSRGAAAGEVSREADAHRPNDKSSSMFNKNKKRKSCQNEF